MHEVRLTPSELRRLPDPPSLYEEQGVYLGGEPPDRDERRRRRLSRLKCFLP